MPLAPAAFQLHPLYDQTGQEAPADTAEGFVSLGIFQVFVLITRSHGTLPLKVSGIRFNHNVAAKRTKTIAPCANMVSSVG